MSDHIPDELIVEILARLPVASLLRFKSVCKSWCSLITSPSFITKHLSHTKRRSDKLLLSLYTNNDHKEHYLLCPNDKRIGDDYSEIEFPFKSLNGCFRLVGSCNGLICLLDDYLCGLPGIVIWNPSIRRSVGFPMSYIPSNRYRFVVGFGVHPITLEYKVVRILYNNDNDMHEVPPMVELYAQGTGSWRSIGSAAPPYSMVEFMFSQAFVNGAIHWVAYDPRMEGVGFRSLILSFDVVSEAFSVVTLPPTLANQKPRCLSLNLFEESLAVSCVGQVGIGSCCIWVMKEDGVAHSWTKLFSIDPPGGVGRTIGFRKNGEILFSTWGGWLFSYDPGTEKVMNTGVVGCSYSLDTFLETLLLVKETN